MPEQHGDDLKGKIIQFPQHRIIRYAKVRDALALAALLKILAIVMDVLSRLDL